MKHALLISYIRSLYDHASTVQGVHWNITGMQFYSLHTMTEAWYTEIYEAIDEFAERVRAFSESMPFLHSITPDTDFQGNTSQDILKQLILLQEKTKKLIAEYESDPVTEDMFIGFLQKIEKQLWMFSSQLS